MDTLGKCTIPVWGRVKCEIVGTVLSYVQGSNLTHYFCSGIFHSKVFFQPVTFQVFVMTGSEQMDKEEVPA